MRLTGNGLVKYHKWLNVAIGAGDGLIVPIAVMGAVLPFAGDKETVTCIGLGIAIIGTIVMALGGYFTNKSAVEGLKREAECQARSEAILKHIDMGDFIGSEIPDPHEAEAEAKLMQMQQEFATAPDAGKLPFHAALQIGLAYLWGGMLAVLLFQFWENIVDGFLYTAATCFLLLIPVGAMKTPYNGISLSGNIFRMLLIGAVAIPGPFIVAYYYINGNFGN